MRILFLIIVCLTGVSSFSQCKTFRLTSNGDTLNCVDMNNRKQGKWLVHVDELRGEPGYEEEGIYKDDKKAGRWRRYNLMGDLTAIENYKWGNKDGTQQYFEMGFLEHEESWLAVDPKKKYDTIDVPDVYDQYKIEKKIIKINAYSMKHGVWKYYRPGSHSLVKTETYAFDSLYVPKPDIPQKSIAGTSSTVDSTLQKPANAQKLKPKEVLDFEKKYGKKKSVKVRDGNAGY
ncbi:MAG: hypothetical protein KGO81_11490 [Bacteroidota bacterium]|nr:hypothetical protein [Bacteroidota bacterium]